LIKINQILILEPENITNYFPFSILHPLWELRVGCHRIFEKIKIEFPETKLFYFGRDKIKQSFLKRFNINDEELDRESFLIINSKVLPNTRLWDDIFDVMISYPEKSFVITKNNEPVVSWFDKSNWVENLTKKDFSNLNNQIFSNFKRVEISDLETINFLHDSITLNEKAIKDDSKNFKLFKKFERSKFPYVYAINEYEIYIGDKVSIYPSVVLDASAGPIIINRNVKIMPQSTIIGPCYIGSNSVIKVGAKIYEKTSIGEFCKIGGEVENSIIQSYSNKQHEGFLGHSFISEWVNFGADTNNSDLKNTYGNISLRYRNEIVDTKQMFMGLLCGDHTKTAINTRFNTGTTVGVCGIIFTPDFPPTYIPSFAWGGAKNSPKYKFQSAIETAKIVMQRRNRQITEIEVILIKEEYDKV
jgi:UDP-N-acetylglucosamine diphosphorylase/glucosamine-1-phosphate N-acetyltransferase